MNPVTNLGESLELIERYQIEPFRSGPERLRQLAVAFTGAPRKHSRDPERILLVIDPFSQHGFVYEFRAADLVYAEGLPSLAMSDGSTVSMARLWVRKGSKALKLEAFQVEDTAQHLEHLW